MRFVISFPLLVCLLPSQWGSACTVRTKGYELVGWKPSWLPLMHSSGWSAAKPGLTVVLIYL